MRRATKILTGGVAGTLMLLPVAVSQAAPSLSPSLAPGASQEPEQAATVVRTKASIPGEWVVTMEEHATAKQRREAMQVARQAGSKRLVAYPKALNGFSGRLTVKARKQLSRLGAVEVIEGAQPMYLTENRSTQFSLGNKSYDLWGLDRIDQESLPLDDSITSTLTGAGVRAYVVDTGLVLGHEQLTGRVLPGTDTGDSDADPTDCDGHGTHVAGIIGGSDVGVAPEVDIVPVKVFACTGQGDSNMFLQGLEWIADNHPAGTPGVVNASLTFKGHFVFLERAIERSIAGGLSWTIAAGNDNLDACGQALSTGVPRALSVGASTASDTRADFSNRGPCVDVFAPGDEILSGLAPNNSSYGFSSGTSMAAPFVAGVAALYLQGNPSATPARVKGVLLNRATQGVLNGATLGTGSPNRLLNMGFLN